MAETSTMIEKSKSPTYAGRTESKCPWRESSRFTNFIFPLIVFNFVATLAIIFVISYNDNEPIKQTCLKCSRLKEIVDKWAWRGSMKQNGDNCCFEGDADLLELMKYYLEKKMTGDRNEIKQLNNRVDGLMFKIMENETRNGTLEPPVNFSRLIDLIQHVFHRQNSILHLESSFIPNLTEPLVIQWSKFISQGNISYNSSRRSVTVHTTALYYLTVRIKFRASITANNMTENTTIQFYVQKTVQNHPSIIESYKKNCVFHNKMTEHDAYIQTIIRLDYGYEIMVSVPTSQGKYVAPNTGSHKFIIFEMR